MTGAGGPALIVSGRGLRLTADLRARIARKLDGLTRLVPRAVDARLTCEAEKFRRTVRLTVRDRRRTFAAAGTAADLLVALDEAVEAIRRQARDAGDRRRSRRRGGARPARDVA